MARTPAAEGTSDYRNRGRVSKLTNQSDHDENARDRTIGTIKPVAAGQEQYACKPTKPIRPDRRPPSPHKMGEYTWNKESRKLDALFAIYVMGWETKDNGHSKWRYFIKPLATSSSKQKWESDMLPYFHDDVRSCYKGVELLKQNGKYLTIETRKDGYEVVEKTMNLSVRDKDLNFAIMAICLLIKGVSKKDIQSATSQQDDWTNKASKRRQEKDNGS